ncbi:hypothetical protein [Noviherbaspirillum sp. ST9]|uniref:hypothetical protein n=1 Tax=Noviherbaspirillum sp. ST9 TaxID=3401606 RepID=UPI003B589580
MRGNCAPAAGTVDIFIEQVPRFVVRSDDFRPGTRPREQIVYFDDAGNRDAG